MKVISSRLIALGALLFFLAPHSSQAQATRTFVAATGADANNCSLTAPCRTFQHAHDQTNPGGEITVLSAAGYGPLTITKAISIVNDGVGEAGVTAVNATAIMVSATPGDVINLRGLTLVGSGTADYGIRFATGGTLNIQNSVIRGFSSGGVFFYPGGVGASNSLNISDTVLSNNINDGVLVQPTGSLSTVTAALERVQSLGNTGAGFDAVGYYASGGTVVVTASDCVASGNSIGFQVATNATGGKATMAMTNSRAVGNSRGVEASGATALLSMALSTLAGNATGYYQVSPAVVSSFHNNFLFDTTNMGSLTLANPG